MIANFFIQRPVFAWVIAILIMLTGGVAIRTLPVSQYPDIAPPTVVVSANYPGASAQAVESSVTQVLEQQLKGIDGLLYFKSTSSSAGWAEIAVTFRQGINPDTAQVQVQNKVSQATSRLPQAVQQQGVTVAKSQNNFLLIVALYDQTDRRTDTDVADWMASNLRDPISRVDGVGSVQAFGASYAMRIWLDPHRLASYQLMPSDVTAAITAQNTQVSVGEIGARPSPAKQQLTATVTALSRLQTPEQFRDIVLKTQADGAVVRLGDVARVEMGSESYAETTRLNGHPAAGAAVMLAPGANALTTASAVKARIAEMEPSLPAGLRVAYAEDTTRFVKISIKSVIKTLLEAIALVVVVMYLFLQNWRATVIPAITVPVVLLGTFGVLAAFGYSINVLTLFGMVLAIGLLVDDAIVVVENVERNIQDGLTPHAATIKAMQEVSGPIIAIALVLCAVFIPLTLVPGLSGQFYKQFAVTIAISTVISAFNSLTLSPALAAILLRPHDAPKDALMRGMDKVFGRFFHWFNCFFQRRSADYGRGVTGILKRKSLALIVYALLLGATVLLLARIPSGFVPAPDKQYLIGIAQLPAGASLDRTEEVIRRMSEIALKVPGIKDSVAFPGLSGAGFSAAPNEGIVFFGLESFEKRTSHDLSKEAILGKVNGAIQQIQGARMFVVPPPPVDGLGIAGGFKIQVQDRSSQGEQALYGAVWGTLGQIYGNPNTSIGTPYSNYDINVPQLFANVDRTKAKQMGVPLGSIYDTLQINLGSLYVNDFTKFGKTYQVIVQADAPFRAKPEDITQLKTRNGAGEMVPLGSLMSVEPTFGPTRVTRYNGFPSADINGAPKPGFSSGQAEGEIERLLKTLPRGFGYEFTELSYQDRLTRDVTVPGLNVQIPTLGAVLLFSVLLVILVLAAQYESWSLPLAIILIVPMCILSALFGVWLSHFPPFGQAGDLNIFTQVALVVLVGLACKNAILIVEFAKELEEQGKTIRDAVIEACRLRLRPILMTSIAFCAGVIPLILGSGAGSEMRRAMGIAVFAGMLGVTFFGIFLTPVFYSLLRASTEKRRARAAQLKAQIDASAHAFHPGIDDASTPKKEGH